MVPGTGRFRRADRLLRSREFQRVARRGRRAVGRAFVVVVAPREGAGVPGPRLGISVSRRIGGAVVRNHIKRHVREWFRQRRGEVGEGLDVVVIARSGAGELSRAELEISLGDLVRSARSAGA